MRGDGGGDGLLLGRLNLIYFRYGKVERVKKIKCYAFIHFEEREQALAGERTFVKFSKILLKI